MSYSNGVYLHGYCNLFIHYFNIISTHSLQLSIAPTTQIHRKNPYEKSDRNPHEKPTRKPVGSAPICHWSASAPRGCCRSATARLLPICRCQVAADLPLWGCCRLLLIWVWDLSEEESLGRTRKERQRTIDRESHSWDLWSGKKKN